MTTQVTTAPTATQLSDVEDLALRIYARRLHNMPLTSVKHEERSVESLPPSPVADIMRHLVDAELESRIGEQA